jgi:hypothetical protein
MPKRTPTKEKRKRDDESVTESESEEYLDEPVEKSKKKKKQDSILIVTPKKTPKKDKKTPVKTPKKDDPHPLIVKEDPNSLFASIREEGVAIATIVNDWITRYDTDKYAAIAELITLFLQASGCNTTFHKEELVKKNLDLNEIIDGFVSSCVGDDYPIVSKHKDMKIFVVNYLEFLEILMDTISNGILFDTILLDCVLNWTTTLSNSHVRAFRHTSTLTLFHLMNSMILIHKTFQTNLSKLKKKKDDVLSERVQFLDTKLNDLFESIFTNRFKDTTNHIRALCMVSLGEWILMDPERYLNDNSLKYIGWTLYDKDSGVREMTLSTCHKLYSNNDFTGPLSNFTKKFVDRFVEMNSDISLSVSVESIKMCIVLLKHAHLNKTQITEVTRCIFDENQSIRSIAAKFIHARFKKVQLNELVELMSEFKDVENAGFILMDSCDVTLNIEELINELEEKDDVTLLSLLGAYCKTHTESIRILPLFPTLLMKYNTKPNAMPIVLEMILTCVPSVIVENHLEKDFTEMIKMIKNFMAKCTDMKILDLCCKCLHHFVGDDFGLSHVALTVSDEMIRGWIQTKQINKIRAFITSRDIPNVKIIQSMIHAKMDDPEDVTDADVNTCLEIMMIHYLWSKEDKTEFVSNCLSLGTKHAFLVLCDLDVELDLHQTDVFVNLFTTCMENEEEDECIKLLMAFGKSILFGGIGEKSFGQNQGNESKQCLGIRIQCVGSFV